MSAHQWLWFLRMACPLHLEWVALSLGIQANSPRLAGGQAVNSHMERMMTVVPEHIHDRSGIFMGSYEEVQKVIDIHQKHIKQEGRPA